jgi:hypothetical protein
MCKMRESVKSVAILLLIICVITSFVVWTDDRPTQMTWIWRVVLLIGVLLCAAVLWIATYWIKQDFAPDLLRERFTDCWERNGLCFMVFPAQERGYFF